MRWRAISARPYPAGFVRREAGPFGRKAVGEDTECGGGGGGGGGAGGRGGIQGGGGSRGGSAGGRGGIEGLHARRMSASSMNQSRRTSASSNASKGFVRREAGPFGRGEADSGDTKVGGCGAGLEGGGGGGDGAGRRGGGGSGAGGRGGVDRLHARRMSASSMDYSRQMSASSNASSNVEQYLAGPPPPPPSPPPPPPSMDHSRRMPASSSASRPHCQHNPFSSVPLRAGAPTPLGQTGPGPSTRRTGIFGVARGTQRSTPSGQSIVDFIRVGQPTAVGHQALLESMSGPLPPPLDEEHPKLDMVGRWRLMVYTPVLKAPVVSALETIIS